MICPSCGQLAVISGETLCERCMDAMYDGNQRHETQRLFSPAPCQPEGQESIDLDA
jgi:hypothetical protein